MSIFRELFGGIAQGAGDVARAGFVDIQNHYAQSVWGQPAPVTAPTGEMERSTDPIESAPQSYDAALREHSNMEQADIRGRHEAAQLNPTNSPPSAPEAPSYGPEL